MFRFSLAARGWLTLAACALCATQAIAASPSLSIILPRGAQRGTETVLEFHGARLADAQQIFFYEPGFEVTKLEAEGDGKVKATVKIAPDCTLGEHVAQVRTASGISEYKTFFVGALPPKAEVEPNSDFATPQAVDLNVTVEGVVDNEDVDYYVVEAKKGQRITAEVEGMRLSDTMFDPYVAILDEKRFELSAADDSPIARQDAVASVVAPEDGKYIIECRESAYGGNGNCRYRLHIGNFPQPTAVFPAGGKFGEEIDVRFLGDPTGEIAQKVAIPSKPVTDYAVFASDATGIAPTGIPFRQFQHGNAFEAEPNNGVAEATLVELPNAFNGIIEKPGDIDFFKFKAAKGQVFEVECYARRVRSSLDPVMVLYRADGAGLASADDARGPDSYFRYQFPEDGEYLLSVTDHLGRGGADFVYRVEFQPVAPQLVMGIPRVARYSQYRQTIFVPRGNRFASLVSASRANFGGEIVLEPSSLPAGVTMVAPPMAANLAEMPVVFEAADDAALSGQLVDFRGKLNDPAQNISGGFQNRADYVIAEPGQSLYAWKDVDQLAIAVVDKLPFKLEIVEPKVPLVQNGTMQLKIVATREEGFTKPITVQFPFRPPGVGAPSAVTIPEGQNEVTYELNASAGAEVKKWPVFALGSADVNGEAWVSSQMATLEIAPPFVQFVLERAAVEQGKETEVFCKIQADKPFEGEAKVQLVGLPAAVTAPELVITKDTTELAFKVTTKAESPVGKHKNIFCQVVIMQGGEPVVHARLGDTEVQIDAPLPAPQAAPMPAAQAAAAPAAPTEPAPKRLTRLEKLRLEAEERKKAAASGG